MRRREFIFFVFGTAACPLAVRAQQTGKIPSVGILASEAGPGGVEDGIVQGLRDFGYVDQRNITLHFRWSAGRQERYSALASELINLGVDVIVAGGPRCGAVFALTKTIPLVCPNLYDPVTKGLIASFNRPGGNVTGNLLLFPALFHKRFQLLKEAVPTTKRVRVLWRADNRSLLDWTMTGGRLENLEVTTTRRRPGGHRCCVPSCPSGSAGCRGDDSRSILHDSRSQNRGAWIETQTSNLDGRTRLCCVGWIAAIRPGHRAELARRCKVRAQDTERRNSW
jgi:putative ABC transport system substrate-binding protein